MTNCSGCSISLIAKIKTAILAGVRHLSNGLKIVSQYQHDEREKICLGCIKYVPEKNECGHCGCKLEIKLWMPLEKCPIDKWSEIRE